MSVILCLSLLVAVCESVGMFASCLGIEFKIHDCIRKEAVHVEIIFFLLFHFFSELFQL